LPYVTVTVAIFGRVCHKPAAAARLKGCRGGIRPAHQSTLFFERHQRWSGPFVPDGPHQETKMPKIKTKSGAKKRFKITGTGKVLYAQRGKRHGMIKRTKKQIRNLRGTNVLFKSDGDNIKKYWLPNG
jgi:large subunit ribosomal protein L35